MSSTNYHNEKAKVGRSATSCLECQRRKQKVNFGEGESFLLAHSVVSTSADTVVS